MKTSGSIIIKKEEVEEVGKHIMYRRDLEQHSEIQDAERFHFKLLSLAARLRHEDYS